MFYYRRTRRLREIEVVTFDYQTGKYHIQSKLSVLLYLISADFSTIKNGTLQRQSADNLATGIPLHVLISQSMEFANSIISIFLVKTSTYWNV